MEMDMNPTTRKYNSLILTLALGLLLMVVYAPLATAAGGPPCHAKNDRTNEEFHGLTAFADALADPSLLAGDTVKIWGTCTGNFIVTQSLTLVGQGQNATLDGNNTGPVFSVIGAVTVEIHNLTVTHGLSAAGGGIFVPYSGGTVNLNNSTVTQNIATGTFVGGGGIYSAGTVTLNTSTVTQNNNTSTFGQGGGIASEGLLTLNNSTVSSNRAPSSGGIWGSRVVLNNSSVTGNTASSGSGGGVVITAGGALTLNGSSSITWNTASCCGGAVDTEGSITLNDNSSVSNNTASCIGGAIYNFDGTLTLNDNSSVKGNSAAFGGGIILIPGGEVVLGNNSTVSGNTASVSGGGIWVYQFLFPGVTGNVARVFGNNPDNIVFGPGFPQCPGVGLASLMFRHNH
jgi:hypothetical protein